MGKYKKLKIKEDLKRDLLEYLEENVREDSHLDLVTFSGLHDQFDIDADKLQEIITELEIEDLLDIHDVSFKLYLPKNENGHKLYSRLTSNELISFSSTMFMIFSLILFYVGLPYLNISLPDNFQDTSLLRAFREGIRVAIIYCVVAGPVGGEVLISGVKKLKQMQVLSPKIYHQLNTIIKYTIWLSVGAGIFYPSLSERFSFEATNAAVSLFFASLGLSIAYVTLRKEK